MNRGQPISIWWVCVNRWLVALLSKHRLIRSPLCRYFLHKLVLNKNSLLDEELRHGICLGQAGNDYSWNVTVSCLSTFAIEGFPHLLPGIDPIIRSVICLIILGSLT